MTTRLQNDAGEDPVRGDDITVERTITSVPAAQTLTHAWLGIKGKPGDADDDAILIVRITTVSSPRGVISVEEGGTLVRFEILAEDYGDVIEADKEYHYDIQTRTSAGLIRTHERGVVVWDQDITRETQF